MGVKAAPQTVVTLAVELARAAIVTVELAVLFLDRVRRMVRSDAVQRPVGQTFEDAHSIGLVNHVWSDAELNGRSFAQAIQDYARQFTPPNKAAKAVGHIKRAVQSGLESGFSEGLALERELQQRLFESDDAKEGLKANLEKRKPNFSGR